VFEGGEPGGPATMADATNERAPGPMQLLLLAVAGCAGAGVVSILEQTRAGLRGLRIEIAGTKRHHMPKRFIAIHLSYHLSGEGLDQAKASRAADLSIQEYCAVLHTFAPDVRVSYEFEFPAA